ncbi:MAG: hypothetical protein KDA61_04690, partial [Planctomycetales bacterium]|nr:hypothetical protein [Planctomycetales bacterium]
LAERPREAIHLCYVEGLKPAQLAERLNRKVNAVYQLLFRARQSLIECVKQTVHREAGRSLTATTLPPKN